MIVVYAAGFARERDGGERDAKLRVADSAEVWRELSVRRERSSASELRPGQRVRVWLVGPVADSYPVMATAQAVFILAP